MRAHKIVSLFLVGAIGLFFLNSFAYAGVPQLINYHGTLTDKTGATVPDGQYAVVFSIYDVPTGGTPLWTETWNDTSSSSVVVTGGSFNAVLGTFTPIPLSFFSDHPVTYLGVKVGNDSEMLPRQRIVSVGYAFTAGDGVPKGGIIMWSGAVDQIPDGWALCDGNNGTPDLRDRFVLGAGNKYNKGDIGGEAMHTLTIAEMPSHTHIQNPHSHQTIAGFESFIGVNPGDTNRNLVYYNASGTGNVANAAPSVTYTSEVTATNQYTGGGQPHNNMPPYYALAYIMKL